MRYGKGQFGTISASQISERKNFKNAIVVSKIAKKHNKSRSIKEKRIVSLNERVFKVGGCVIWTESVGINTLTGM